MPIASISFEKTSGKGENERLQRDGANVTISHLSLAKWLNDMVKSGTLQVPQRRRTR